MNIIIKLKPFLCFLLLPPAAGIIPFLIAPSFAARYESEIRPVLCYPFPVFLLLWFFMLALAGLAGYLSYQSRGKSRSRAVKSGTYFAAGLLLWALFVFSLRLPLVGMVLMCACAVCALKFAAETLWVSKAGFVLCGIEFLWAVYLAANSFFLWRM